MSQSIWWYILVVDSQRKSSWKRGRHVSMAQRVVATLTIGSDWICIGKVVMALWFARLSWLQLLRCWNPATCDDSCWAIRPLIHVHEKFKLSMLTSMMLAKCQERLWKGGLGWGKAERTFAIGVSLRFTLSIGVRLRFTHSGYSPPTPREGADSSSMNPPRVLRLPAGR